MKILILGGTKFLGRHLADFAAARGHEITLFNRGQSNPDWFPKLEKLHGDRNGNLEALLGRRWDAVIDTSGQVSHQVRATAELLAASVGHYTFISSVSVYADFSRRALDETATVAALPFGIAEEESDSTTYGARKALCERAAEKIMPGRVLTVRPGIIVGPHDMSDRFAYWVRRVAEGGETLAPENPDVRIQLIDVRDLAEWIVRMVEKKQTGTFNATGPRESMTFGQMLEICKSVTGSDARFTWVDGQYLLDNSVRPFRDLPLWIPQSDKVYAGHYFIRSDRAFQCGLECRPVEETVRDICVWDRERIRGGQPIQKAVGLTAERERELLRIWKANN